MKTYKNTDDLILELRNKGLIINNEDYAKDMLKKYGRNSINIKLIGEGTYYFDFSRNNKEGVINEQ